jgi:hypothetical protein
MTATLGCTSLPVTIGIATTGRRDIVGQTIAFLAAQNDVPARLIVSIADPQDFDTASLPPLPFPLQVLTGPKGSCVQRNAILDAVGPQGIILFLDDDFLISDGYVSALRRLFDTRGEMVVATGCVLADGIQGQGFTHEQGRALLAHSPPPAPDAAVQDEYSAYGCNMAIRASVLADHPERFDEAMPLYGWLEDMDLTRRLARRGRILRSDALTGVHLGTRTGRSPGVTLGYSQVANPIYLIRKGTVRPAVVLRIMARNMMANMLRSLRPEPWIDRRGRLRGNMLALADLVRGRCSPGRVLDLAARHCQPSQGGKF